MKMPRLTANALRYTVTQLANRAGSAVQETAGGMSLAGMPLVYADPAAYRSQEPAIYVVPAAEDAWHALLAKAPHTLDWSSADNLLPDAQGVAMDALPVLFWGQQYERAGKPFVQRCEDGSVVFHADILAATLFMLSRWEEAVIPAQDEYGRFPATASVAYKQGFLDRPLVDEYALVLQAWLRVLRPDWTPQPRPFAVKLSHDIDHIRRIPNLYWAGRAMAADLLKRGSLRQAAQTLQATVAGIFAPAQDPYLLAIYELADLSRRHGLDSAFYFMAAEPSRYDSGYDLAWEAMRRCLDDLRRRGHEVGFHPSYYTLDDPQRFAAEKARMDDILGQAGYGGRQHYLRFRVPDTWRQWETAGLAYDSTLGYSFHEGFRCGTCHPYQPFDLQADRQLDVEELPLIAMDRTLRQHRGLTPAEGEERVLTLAQRCRQVNGIFTLLWHNSSLHSEWEPWAKMYRRVLPRLAALVGRNSG